MYIDNIRSVNSLLLFILGNNIEKRKLIDGKKIAFISLWASFFSICLFVSIIEVKMALLGKPFKIPIIIILAPFPLILNKGMLIYWRKYDNKSISPKLMIIWLIIRNGNKEGNIVFENVISIFNVEFLVSFIFSKEYIKNIKKNMEIIVLYFFIAFTI